jgi:3-oxoadipate enol-lactonase
VADLGRDMLALLDFLQLPAVSLVGLSLGGAVGQWLALHAPQRLERLVLLCTSARFGEPAGWLERAAAVRAAGTGAVADAVLGRWFTPAFARARPEVLAEMRTMITSTVAEGYAACCDALSRWDARADLPSVGTPTLVVSAGDDPSTPPEHGELLAAGIPGARFEVLAGAAHLANVEQPERVTALIGEHLGGRSG